MKRPRITIGHLALVVLVVGFGLAAIRSGSSAWAGAMLSITFFVMTCSVLGAVLERDMHRIYWSGFATLGWTYLFLSFAPWLNERVGTYLFAPNLLVQLHELLHPVTQGSGGFQSLPVEIPGAAITGGGFGGMSQFWSHGNFVRIGVSIEALLWASLGGWVSCYFASGRVRRSDRRGVAPTRVPEADAQTHAMG